MDDGTDAVGDEAEHAVAHPVDEGAVVERTFTRTTKSLEDAAAPSGDADGEQPKKSTAKRTQSRSQ